MAAHFAGATRRAKAAQRGAAWAAYQTAALMRTSKFPRTFAEFIGEKPARSDPMSQLRSLADRLPKHRLN